MKRLWRVIRVAFLLSLAPLIGWGPIAHPEINRRALRRARDELQLGNPRVNRDLVERLEHHQEEFIFAGNSADAISLQHVTRGVTVYDYAHNAIPDCAVGEPVFGQRLIDRWQHAHAGGGSFRYPDRELAIACGWLAHQLADWYAHYAATGHDGKLLADPAQPVDEATSFSGFADGHTCFGADFAPEVFRDYTVIDHAAIELLYDIGLVARDSEGFYDDIALDFFDVYPKAGREYCLLTDTSELFGPGNCRIPVELVRKLAEDFDMTVKGMRVIIEFLLQLKPLLGVQLNRWLDQLPEHWLDLAVERVVERLFMQPYEAFCEDQCPLDRAGLATAIGQGFRKQSGSTLYPVAYGAGQFPLASLLELLRSDIVKLPLGVSVHTLLVKRLAGNLTVTSLRRLGQGDSALSATMAFAGDLIAPKSNGIRAARASFRRRMQPVIAGPDGHPLTPAAAAALVESGFIRLQLIPALPLEHGRSSEKHLDPRTFLLRINGYAVTDDAVLSPADDSGRIRVTYRVSDSHGPVRHIFADIYDREGVHSRYVDLEVGTDH